MALKQIKTPRGCIIQGDKGKAELRWDSSFTPRANQNFNRMQKFVDSEVLRTLLRTPELSITIPHRADRTMRTEELSGLSE